MASRNGGFTWYHDFIGWDIFKRCPVLQSSPKASASHSHEGEQMGAAFQTVPQVLALPQDPVGQVEVLVTAYSPIF